MGQLVNITPIIMVYGTSNYSYWGLSLPILDTLQKIKFFAG